jgi:hypothetical protein
VGEQRGQPIRSAVFVNLVSIDELGNVQRQADVKRLRCPVCFHSQSRVNAGLDGDTPACWYLGKSPTLSPPVLFAWHAFIVACLKIIPA